MTISSSSNTTDALIALQQKADQFAKDFAQAKYEMGEAQNFIRGLCEVYDLNPLHSVNFEFRVKKADRSGINRIDGFFPGLLLIEMKSRGEDLDKAFEQALSYLPLLKNEADRPAHILVSDFENLHLYELDDTKTAVKDTLKFKLYDFQKHVEALAFIGNFERIISERSETLTLAAADKLASLHDAFLTQGYSGEALQTMLVRLLFCLFGDDTELFEEDNPFEALINQSQASGENLGDMLNKLFKWLDTNEQARQNTPKPLLEQYNGFRLKFPYINGKLFSHELPEFIFDGEMRKALLACCELDWSEISPDIFGTLFQNIMESEDAPKDKKAGKKSQHRRDFGAHYTSTKNILRAIRPLFLDSLKEEFELVADNEKKLNAFLAKLQTLEILDPACGCGNFLIVAYREIRHLEMQALQQLESLTSQRYFPQVDVNQFHGFEIDPAAVEIATVAMWLTDHQMNRRFESGYKRLPLNQKADIHCLNALSQSWSQTLNAPQNISYIVGNPPFLGKTYQSASQKADMKAVCGEMKNFASLDYVCGWYVQAVKFMQEFTKVKTAFVSTNSITQGEQVAVLWQPLLEAGVFIQFAHRTFKWSNEGKGVAAVHCVIIGLGMEKPRSPMIWDYSDGLAGKGKATRARRINPYLVDADNLLVEKRTKQISNELELVNGGKPVDGGYLLLEDSEKIELLSKEPQAQKYIKAFSMGDEFINNIPRWCLWFADCNEADLQEFLEISPLVKERIENVRKMRLASTKAATQKLAVTPHLFGEVKTSNGKVLVIPKVSSERREFVPIGFTENTICGDKLFFLPNATHYHFGILCSSMHNAFMRTVAGRLESRYSYSNTIVYNNFPFPDGIDQKAKWDISQAAQTILDVRAEYEGKSLAWLYNPDTMPKRLKDAHFDLDQAVDDAYNYNGRAEDADRVAFLFGILKQR